MKFGHTFRFTNGANAGTFNLTGTGLLNLILMTPTAITSVRLFEAIKLRRVRIWANPTALGSAPVTISLEWFGYNAPSTVVSDTTIGVSPAKINTRPPPNSSAAWWVTTGGMLDGAGGQGNLATIILPADCVIDIDCQVRLVEQEAPHAGDVPAAATIGQIYGNYLDGFASGQAAPVGYIVLP